MKYIYQEGHYPVEKITRRGTKIMVTMDSDTLARVGIGLQMEPDGPGIMVVRAVSTTPATPSEVQRLHTDRLKTMKSEIVHNSDEVCPRCGFHESFKDEHEYVCCRCNHIFKIENSLGFRIQRDMDVKKVVKGENGVIMLAEDRITKKPYLAYMDALGEFTGMEYV